MHGKFDSGPEHTLRIEQCSSEIQFHRREIKWKKDQGLTVAVGFRRSSDFERQAGPGEPGQDDVAVRSNEEHVVAVLADGVSQSFLGHLAARTSVEALLERLWSSRREPPSCEAFETILATCGEELRKKIETWEPPSDLPPMVADALELARRKGSQAVLAAFVHDIAENRTHLYLIGDIRVFVHAAEELRSVCADSCGRWSSTGQSQLYLQREVLNDTRAIVLASDGAERDWGKSLSAGGPTAEEFRQMIARNGHEDDVSFVAMSRTPGESREEKSTVPSLVEVVAPQPEHVTPQSRTVLVRAPPRDWRKRYTGIDLFIACVSAASLAAAATHYLIGPDPAPAHAETTGSRLEVVEAPKTPLGTAMRKKPEWVLIIEEREQRDFLKWHKRKATSVKTTKGDLTFFGECPDALHLPVAILHVPESGVDGVIRCSKAGDPKVLVLSAAKTSSIALLQISGAASASVGTRAGSAHLRPRVGQKFLGYYWIRFELRPAEGEVIPCALK